MTTQSPTSAPSASKFDPEKKYSYREVYGPAMSIEDQAEADAYYAAIVDYVLAREGGERSEIEDVQRANLGYYAGYYDSETMARVNRLFRTTHPVFGDTSPAAQEAFEAGEQLAGTK